MIGKISLYDFIAAVIPGVLFIWGISLLTSRIEISLAGDLAETSVLIVLAYVFGLIMQGIGQIATEKVLLLIWGGYPSARMLLLSDRFFTVGYKTKLLGLAEGRFGLKANEGKDLKEQLKRNQEIFYLCYNAVDKEKMSERPLLFNALMAYLDVF